MKRHLEVGVRTVEDALAAERGGADRVELYSSPLEGALTPSAGLVKAAAEAVSTLKLFVMLRPRAGDFLYSAGEFETIRRDADIALEMGADGLMCGILDADGRLDSRRMAEVKRRCGDKPFTLHRAFDFSRDPLETLEQAVDVGCDYLLTMGQESEALFPKEVRQRIFAVAEGRITPVVALGADFDTADLADVARDTGAGEFHIVNNYRKRRSAMQWAPGGATESDYLRETMFTMEYLCEKAVREAREVLDRLEGP